MVVAVPEVDVVDGAALRVEAIATTALQVATLAVLAPTVVAMAPADTVVVMVVALAAVEAGAATGKRPTLLISESSNLGYDELSYCFGTSPLLIPPLWTQIS